jgi:hypothetical protein
MGNAAPEHQNAFQDQIALLLACLHDRMRLQVQWFCDSDYRAELLSYHEQTQRATNVWTRRTRNERFARYWQAMQERRLRRQHLVLFFSRSIDVAPPTSATSSGLRKHYEAVLQQLDTEFAQLHEMLGQLFPGARIVPMDDAAHFRHTSRFLNPSFAERFDFDPLSTFEPELSIHENCWHSEACGLAENGGFFMDGHFHGILVVNRWPKMTHPGIVRRLTELPLLDYCISVNVAALSSRMEI